MFFFLEHILLTIVVRHVVVSETIGRRVTTWSTVIIMRRVRGWGSPVSHVVSTREAHAVDSVDDYADDDKD